MAVQTERDEVERPIVAQLQAMGWRHVPGTEVGTLDVETPLLVDELDEALRRINVRASDHKPWMDGTDVKRSIAELASVSLGKGVAQANFDATDLLLSGLVLSGPSAAHGGASATVQYIEWREERAALNDFTVVDQLRVQNRSGELSVLDIVLFVNGIPLVAVECKSPDLADPIRSAVLDLRHYAGDPVADDGRDDPALFVPAGVPELFRTVQLLVAATEGSAYLGTVTSTPDHFHPWRSIEPQSEATLRAELPDHTGKLNERHKLFGVVLRPAALLNVVRHYVIPLPVETESGATRTVKAVARHQQYRATEKSVHRLLTGRTRGGSVADDERGGIIWHTQGSGKSLTMTFLVRRIHLHHRLSEFMVVVVTDRTQLQDQLSKTLKLSESDVETAATRPEMEGLLRDGGRRVVFAMIQKYGTGFTFAAEATGDEDDRDLAEEYQEAERVGAGRQADTQPPVVDFPECNTSSDILVLVDEAHRSHTNTLHAALRKAIPRAAKIGFTGTPIMTGRLEDTRRIFGGFLDTYRMAEAEHDRVVVRIRYEGRTGEGKVFDKDGLDRNFADLVRDLTDDERNALRRSPTARDVAETQPMIRAKAEDMLEHWVTWVLPGGGFKAQVAAVSRKAAVEYHHALRLARDTLLAELAAFDPESVAGMPPEKLPRRLRYLHQAYQYRSLLRRIDFVPIISPGAERKRREWLQWTDKDRQKAYIERFHQAFPHLPPESEWVATTPFHVPAQAGSETSAVGGNPWSQDPVEQPQSQPTTVPDPVHPESPIAFLIVKSMLLTGFDAPREQALYLDRPIRGAELLQAVARVNRPMQGKDVGYVVDYHGVFEHLSGALAAYQQADIDDTMRSLSEEIDGLGPAAEAVRAYLRAHGVAEADLSHLGRLGSAALAFEDETARFGYDEVLHQFLAVLERVLPHEHGLEYIADARRWGMLQKRIRRLYRDESGGSFTLRRYGRKVRAMIANHLEGPEIEQVIAPVSLASTVFDDRVRAMPPREAAAEMGHALRFHLEERVKREDPAKYAELSERLEEILRELTGRFEEQIEAFGPLIEQARRENEEDPELAGLTPLEQRVYRLLEQLLAENPGVVRRDGATRLLVDMVCDTAAQIMVKASFQGQHQDLDALANSIQNQLIKGGLRVVGADWAPLRDIAQRLTAYAAGNRRQFLGRLRGE
ncbi:DEAD/DEAH box helicase family protein [Streptomyces viridifaciens]|nr:type I restriction endonuclease subunit R [Streptomyces viridifaciens]UKZ07221.1 DEAD/DEAH box helicase family protein [Streptomyces viridifaciens]